MKNSDLRPSPGIPLSCLSAVSLENMDLWVHIKTLAASPFLPPLSRISGVACLTLTGLSLDSVCKPFVSRRGPPPCKGFRSALGG